MLEYDNDSIIEMCNSIDLLDYASQSYTFEKKGNSYFTSCPKHIDKTPSLSITPSKNLFHCFSCGASGNIINWMMVYEGLNFQQSLEKLVKMTGIDISKLKKADALIIFKKLRDIQIINDITLNREIYDSSLLNLYELETPQEWINEGINPDIMNKYNIRIDKKANRIIYPVYDNNLCLIGVKGRTRYSNYKELGLKKYQNYQKIGTTDFFTGMKENKDIILQKNEAIIFEGIKSGMKVEAWGYDNWLASETSCLNNEQIKILIDMKIKNIVIAFDNDVEIDKIKECTTLLKKFTNVYYIHDRKKLLGKKEDKMSPCDAGKEIWETLYNERVKIK